MLLKNNGFRDMRCAALRSSDKMNDILLWGGNEIPHTIGVSTFWGFRRTIHLAEDEEWKETIDLRRELCEKCKRRPNRVDESVEIDVLMEEKVEKRKCTRREDGKCRTQFCWHCITCDIDVCQSCTICHWGHELKETYDLSQGRTEKLDKVIKDLAKRMRVEPLGGIPPNFIEMNCRCYTRVECKCK